MENEKEKYPEVFDYILQEETNFRTSKVPLASNWDWNMYEHIDKSYMLKNSKFTQGNNDNYSRIFKQIILPILNVSYRTEGFDVKNIEVFVDDKDYYHLSMIARKYHKKWALDNSIDKEIDASCVSLVDYGLTLVKNVNDKKPEVVQLQTIAFCDQTDILSGPICLKHNFTIDELLGMKGKWDKESIDRAILQASFSRNVNNRKLSSPNKTVEVYELHGVFPKSWRTLGKEDYQNGDESEYERQLHIVTFYKDSKENKKGISLFVGSEKDTIFKAMKRDDIFGRACGRGGIEELFNEQIWTNYSMIQLKELLDMLSLFVFKTNSKKVTQNTRISDLKKGAILELGDGEDFNMVNTSTPNTSAFSTFSQLLEQNARTIGSASDPQLGINPVSGTPLGTTQIVTSQGVGIHEYRRKQFTDFWNEIYRDWTMSYLQKDLEKGTEWLEELSLNELQEVADKLSVNEANDRIKKGLIEGKLIDKEGQDALIDFIKGEFMKGGKKRFMEALKDEFKELPLKVKFNVSNSSEDFVGDVNKLNNILRAVFSNPVALKDPAISEVFNQILEKSGLSPIDFTNLTKKDIMNSGTQGNSQVGTQSLQMPNLEQATA